MVGKMPVFQPCDHVSISGKVWDFSPNLGAVYASLVYVITPVSPAETLHSADYKIMEACLFTVSNVYGLPRQTSDPRHLFIRSWA